MKSWFLSIFRRYTKASALYPNAAIVLLLLCLLVVCDQSDAQEMPTWEREAHGRIDQMRRKNLRVLVLDQAQKPIGNVSVKITQRRHAMPLGFAVGLGQLPNDIIGQQNLSAPLLRVFNSVNLGEIGRWDQLEPEMGLGDWGRLKYWLSWVNDMGLTVRYGSLFSANTSHQADWAALLGRRDLMASVELHQRQILNQFSNRVIAFDIYSHTLGHQLIEDQLSLVMVRRMYEQATALAPKVPMAVQMDNVLDPQRVQQAVARMSQFKKGFVPIKQWSVSLHIPADVQPQRLQSGLDWLAKLNVPMVVSNLTFAAACDSNAVRNALILLYSHQSVTAIYFGMPTASDLDTVVSHPLLDPTGKLTAMGLVVDDLFAQTWISRGELKTNSSGSLITRVFCGLYDLSATLPDGKIAYSSVFVSDEDDNQSSQTVVISPLAVSLEPLR